MKESRQTKSQRFRGRSEQTDCNSVDWIDKFDRPNQPETLTPRNQHTGLVTRFYFRTSCLQFF